MLILFSNNLSGSPNLRNFLLTSRKQQDLSLPKLPNSIRKISSGVFYIFAENLIKIMHNISILHQDREVILKEIAGSQAWVT